MTVQTTNLTRQSSTGSLGRRHNSSTKSPMSAGNKRSGSTKGMLANQKFFVTDARSQTPQKSPRVVIKSYGLSSTPSSGSRKSESSRGGSDVENEVDHIQGEILELEIMRILQEYTNHTLKKIYKDSTSMLVDSESYKPDTLYSVTCSTSDARNLSVLKDTFE